MIEVHESLYCGSEYDLYDSILCNYRPVASEMELFCCMPEGWAVVHAAKEPFHRMALGYVGRGAPKDHPEYLWAERGNRLALNMVDAPKVEFFDKRMIDKAIEFIGRKLGVGHRVLVHCNKGESRSPSLCLLYLISAGVLKGSSLQEYMTEFCRIYPNYNPFDGILGFIQEHWLEYVCKV